MARQLSDGIKRESVTEGRRIAGGAFQVRRRGAERLAGAEQCEPVLVPCEGCWGPKSGRGDLEPALFVS